MTEQFLDQLTSADRSEELSAPEIATRLGITSRTVYRIIEREGWQRKEGLRGRVTYDVPVSFIGQYLAESQRDRKSASDTTQADLMPVSSQPVIQAQPISDELVALIVGDRDSQISDLKQELKEARAKIEELTNRLGKAERELAHTQGEMSGKDAVIQAKDETIQAKDQAITSSQAAVMLMERQTPTVDVTTTERQIEAAKQPPRWKFWVR